MHNVKSGTDHFSTICISGYAMHNSEGFIVCSPDVLHTSLCVFAPPLARIYWHGIGTTQSDFYGRRTLIESASKLICCAVW